MKILIVNSSDISGGAARAAYRLHLGLQRINLKSQMFVQNKVSDDYTVIGPQSSSSKLIAKAKPIIDSLPVKLYKKRRKILFSSSWVPFNNITKIINSIDPDIVHLHWVANGLLRIEDISKINKPIVWTLHDMWAFTGGCHHHEKCVNFKTQCGFCPVLASNKKNDISYRVFSRKEKTFLKVNNLNVVTPSRWLKSCVKESKLMGSYPVTNVPNPIDTNFYRPLDKKLAIDMLNLPQGKKLIAFGAMNPMGNPNKGYAQLSNALKKLKIQDVELVIFGASCPSEPPDHGFTSHYLGRLNDDISLRILYSAVDLVVVPSLSENLSNVIMESLACGTPVVGFNIGGNPDMIEHKKNGYLAKPYDTNDLAQGIEWVLGHVNPKLLSDEARKKVIECFEMSKVCYKYKEVYEEAIESYR